MALFHLSVTQTKRSAGQSAIASAAYRAGNGTVLSPFGGKTLRTETEGMAALIPVLGKETTTCSLMSHGYNPLISKWSPYHGAMYAIVESVAKIVAMGGNYHTIRF